jgi:hypothetical protein
MVLKALFNFYKKGICIIKALFGKFLFVNFFASSAKSVGETYCFGANKE